MQTRTKNAVGLAVAAVVAGGSLVWVSRHRTAPELRARALDAVPAGALLVATVDLDALRASPVGGPFLRQGREIPGLGKVRDVCGFDPMDTLHEVAVAIPAAGEAGEFGLVAAGEVDDEALLACASKVISARGGSPVVSPLGSFRSVRDASLATNGGEIAVRKGGPLLLGGGAYLRSMVDAAEGRTPTVRSSVAHARLAHEIGGGAVRVTVVLTPEQRQQLAAELPESGRAPGASVVAGGLAADLGPTVTLRAVLACDRSSACAELAGSLGAVRDARAADLGVRLIGLGAVLERVTLKAEGELVRATVSLPAEEASVLVDRMLTLRGARHPMPKADASGPPAAAVPPTAAGSAGAPEGDAGPATDGGTNKKTRR